MYNKSYLTAVQARMLQQSIYYATALLHVAKKDFEHFAKTGETKTTSPEEIATAITTDQMSNFNHSLYLPADILMQNALELVKIRHDAHANPRQLKQAETNLGYAYSGFRTACEREDSASKSALLEMARTIVILAQLLNIPSIDAEGDKDPLFDLAWSQAKGEGREGRG